MPPPYRYVTIKIIIGRTYGGGSLLFRSRTVQAVDKRLKTVTYQAGDAPITSPNGGVGRVEGRTYTCSRAQFLRWMHRVKVELECIHGVRKG